MIGVVRDKKIHAAVIERVMTFAAELGFKIRGVDFSPVKDSEGNIEYLAHLSKVEDSIDLTEKISTIVETAHAELD